MSEVFDIEHKRTSMIGMIKEKVVHFEQQSNLPWKT